MQKFHSCDLEISKSYTSVFSVDKLKSVQDCDGEFSWYPFNYSDTEKQRENHSDAGRNGLGNS